MVLISLLLGIFGLSAIGLILIIIARRKGATGGLATISLLINSVFLIVVVCNFAAVIFFAIQAYINAAAGAASGLCWLSFCPR